MQKIESLIGQINEVDKWNQEAQRMIAEQSRLGIETDGAVETVAQRQNWVEKKWDEVKIRNNGWVA